MSRTVFPFLLRSFRNYCSKALTNPKSSEIIRGENPKEIEESCNSLIDCCIPDYNRKFDEKKVSISILGADERSGQIVGLYLKQHPLIRKLFVHGTLQDTLGIAGELNEIDTDSRVLGFCGPDSIPDAIRAADIVLLLDIHVKESCLDIKLQRSYERVFNLADLCSKHCPRAIIVNCIEPVCCTLPIIQAVFAETPWYHPSRLVGCVAPIQARMNSIAANFLDLDPMCVNIPLIGGPCCQTCVPLLTLMTPHPGLEQTEIVKLTEILLKNSSVTNRKSSILDRTLLSEGYAIAQFAVTVAKGLCGDTDAVSTALLRTNLIPHLRYLVTNVRFGDGGIVDNYGIPKMSRYEVEQFENNILTLQRREEDYSGLIENWVNNRNYERLCQI